MRDAGLALMRLGRAAASDMYWTVAQMVTHHASNGCNLTPGDLLGTGTISAPDGAGLGRLMEIGGDGKSPIALPSGETRSFLKGGNELILRATASAEGHVSIGFGKCRAVVLPAR